MILAIDPGNEKTGIAVIATDSSLVEKAICATADLTIVITDMLSLYNEISTIVMGNGTNHRTLYPLIEAVAQKRHKKMCLVNEAHTTEEARKRYWVYHPPKGLKRLIPLGMQFPPEPVDDFTAWIIGERYLDSLK